MGSANRVEEEDVLRIYTPDDSGLDVAPFIDAAHALVEEVLTASSVALSDTMLTHIEKYLAAHFCAVTCQEAVKEGVGTASIDFGTVLGQGLDQTKYGQQAKLLDTSGTLARLDRAGEEGGGAGGRARFRVIDPAWDGS